ncbi:MAG: hypothetical protein HF978_06430 [Desulfobacteraceae bacterium]|nr:hypothetical protein [Desulfobacteraceae bacterium]MBC2755167.1 hypothetical protein [Desulfobacteraceae bacterium]
MAYTPELSQQQSCTLRRIAWALNMPMTKAMNTVFNYVSKAVDNNKICKSCRDNTRCVDCVFNPENQAKEVT